MGGGGNEDDDGWWGMQRGFFGGCDCVFVDLEKISGDWDLYHSMEGVVAFWKINVSFAVSYDNLYFT